MSPDGDVHSVARPFWQKRHAQHELELHVVTNPADVALKHDASHAVDVQKRLLNAYVADHEQDAVLIFEMFDTTDDATRCSSTGL